MIQTTNSTKRPKQPIYRMTKFIVQRTKRAEKSVWEEGVQANTSTIVFGEHFRNQEYDYQNSKTINKQEPAELIEWKRLVWRSENITMSILFDC